MFEGQYRGWADRVAEVMSAHSSEFKFANLAIRGKLVYQVVESQVPVALQYITGPQTLVSFHAGANDVLRPNYNPAEVLPIYAQAVRKIAASGATVLLFTVLERTDSKGRTADLWESRFHVFNENVRSVAREVGAMVADANQDGFLSDRRFLASDRLHLNALGHDRVAQGVLEKLELPCSPTWRAPLPPKDPVSWSKKLYVDSRWIITFVAPWMWRRARGKSSGDGRTSKHSHPVPLP